MAKIRFIEHQLFVSFSTFNDNGSLFAWRTLARAGCLFCQRPPGLTAQNDPSGQENGAPVTQLDPTVNSKWHAVNMGCIRRSPKLCHPSPQRRHGEWKRLGKAEQCHATFPGAQNACYYCTGTQIIEPRSDVYVCTTSKAKSQSGGQGRLRSKSPCSHSKRETRMGQKLWISSGETSMRQTSWAREQPSHPLWLTTPQV